MAAKPIPENQNQNKQEFSGSNLSYTKRVARLSLTAKGHEINQWSRPFMKAMCRLSK